MPLIDMLTGLMIDRIMPIVVKHIDSSSAKGRVGTIMAGSWDPSDGTASVILNDTAAMPTDQGSKPVILTKIPMQVLMVGQQSGPIGDEQVIMYRTQAGWIAKPFHSPDDSPGAQAGETFMQHLKVTGTDPQTGLMLKTPDLQIQMTNDAITKGDNQVGYKVTGAAVHNHQTTGGHSHVMDDINKAIKQISAGGQQHVMDDVTVAMSHIVPSSVNGQAQQVEHLLDGANNAISHTVQSANGQIKTIVDGAGNAISHIVPTGAKVTLGDAASAMTSVNAALNQSHLTSYETNRQAANLTDLISNATLDHALGIINGTQYAAKLAQLVGGFTSAATVPAGSAKVFHTS